MWWLIVFAVIIAILLIPIGVAGKYDQGRGCLWLRVGPIHTQVFPKKKRTDNRQPKKGADTSSFEEKRTAKPKSNGNISDFFPLVRLVLDFLDTFRRKLRINRLVFKASLSSDDPYDLSVQYGRSWMILGNIVPHLERYFIIKHRDLEVLCDYTGVNNYIFAELDMSISVWNILMIAGYHGVRILYKFIHIVSKRKGGATT